MKKTIVMLLGALLALTGCGDDIGGVGGTNPATGDYATGDYGSIIASSATITQANAEPIALGAVSGYSSLSSQQSSMGSLLGSQAAVASLSSNVAATVRAVTDFPSQTVSGSCGGTITVSGSFDDSSGTLNMSAGFANYCSGGVTISGAYTATGTAQNLTVSSSGISIKASGVDISWSGSFVVNASADLSSVVATMNIVMFDNINKTTSSFDDFRVASSVDGAGVTVSLSGTYADSVNGSVTVETIEPLVYPDMMSGLSEEALKPTSGVIVCTGANGTKVRASFIDALNYDVEADTNGDGTYDFSTGS